MGQKQKTEKKEREERLKVGNNNGQLRIATPPREAHAKLPGPILVSAVIKLVYKIYTKAQSQLSSCPSGINVI